MKLPAWCLPLVTTVMSALIVGMFVWGFRVNAAIESGKAVQELRNEQLMEYKSNTRAEIVDLKQLIIENDKRNELQHERILKILERIRERQ